MNVMAQAVPAPAMRPVPRPGLIQRCGGINCPPGTCDHTDDPADAAVQRSVNATAAVGGSGVPAPAPRVLDTVGTPLDASTRASMEARLGHDFGHVRVHTDAEAARSANSIQAQAYTFGSHVVMGEGRYQPHTPACASACSPTSWPTPYSRLGHPPRRGPSATRTTPPSGRLSGPQTSPGTRTWPRPTDRVHRATDDLFGGTGPDGGLGLDDGMGLDGGLAPGGVDGTFGEQGIGGGGQSGGGGSSGSFDGPLPGVASPSRPPPLICSRPIAVPGLGAFKHAFVNDPPANYAIREPLYSGNGIWGCATTTDASGPPDDPATSTCKPCLPPSGQTLDDLSSCLRNTHLGYASPGIYRNLPDPWDGWSWGPNSNSYVAAMARCCDNFDPSGLGTLPGWNHSPAKPCPSNAPSTSPGDSGEPVAPAAPADGGAAGPTDGGAAPWGVPAPTGVPGVLRQVAVQPVTFKDADDDPNPTGVSWPTRHGWTENIWGKLGVRFTARSTRWRFRLRRPQDRRRGPGQPGQGSRELEWRGCRGVPGRQ